MQNISQSSGHAAQNAGTAGFGMMVLQSFLSFNDAFAAGVFRVKAMHIISQ